MLEMRGRRFGNLNSVYLFVLFVQMGLARGQSGDATSQAKKHYENGHQAQLRGDWRTAEKEYAQAATLVPGNAIIHYDLAIADAHIGQSDDARREIKNALLLGLPLDQKKAAEALEHQLDTHDSVPAHTTAAQRTTAPSQGVSVGGVEGKRLHALNIAVQQAGAASGTYRPGGFTLETSTGKLWWTRVTDAFCKYNVVEASVAMPLNELNVRVTQTKQSDGSIQLEIACSPGASCMQNWAYANCQPMDSWKWRLRTNDYPEAVKIFDKTQRTWRAEPDGTQGPKDVDAGPLQFIGALHAVYIIVANDQTAADQLASNLSELISAHGGKQVSAEDEALLGLVQHDWRAETDDHELRNGCRTTDHTIQFLTFSKDGRSFSFENFYYDDPSCISNDISTCRVDYSGHLVGDVVATTPPSIKYEATRKSVSDRCTSQEWRDTRTLNGTLWMRNDSEIFMTEGAREDDGWILKRQGK